jgi:hypothetical protein
MSNTPKITPTHVELQFRENGADLNVCYAVDGETLRSAQIALAQRKDGMSTQELRDWLSRHGARLDCRDGPAHTAVWADGMKIQEWYRDGLPHRDDGPASITRYTDGATIEIYYRQGKQHRDNGPACITRFADGSTFEAYYNEDKELRTERLVPLSRIVGVKVYPPTPHA